MMVALRAPAATPDIAPAPSAAEPPAPFIAPSPNLELVLQVLDDCTRAGTGAANGRNQAMIAMLAVVDWNLVDDDIIATIVALLMADSRNPDTEDGVAYFDADRRDSMVRACLCVPKLSDVRDDARLDRKANCQELGHYISLATVLPVLR